MQLEQQLKYAQCTSPFNHLGPSDHSASSIVTITAWVPNALAISVIDLKTGRDVGKLTQLKKTDLFSGDFKEGVAPKIYSLRVTNSQTSYDIIDPYQFKEQAYHAVHFVDHSAQNVYRQLGAQLISLDVGLETPTGTVVVYQCKKLILDIGS
jgi:1,4-alpha-glucan branching enzyme